MRLFSPQPLRVICAFTSGFALRWRFALRRWHHVSNVSLREAVAETVVD